MFQSFDSINCWFQANLESKVTAMVSAALHRGSHLQGLLLITQKDVRWFAAAHAVEYAFVAMLLLISYRKSRNRLQPIRFSGSLGRELLGKSYHFIISGMMIALYSQMDRVMLKSMISEEAVGYYSCASTISSFWAFVLVAIIDAAKPVILAKFSENKRAFEVGLIRLYGTILYLSALAAVGLSLLSKPLILIMFGKDYLPARGTLCVLTCGTALPIWASPEASGWCRTANRNSPNTSRSAVQPAI